MVHRSLSDGRKRQALQYIISSLTQSQRCAVQHNFESYHLMPLANRVAEKGMIAAERLSHQAHVVWLLLTSPLHLITNKIISHVTKLAMLTLGY